VAAEGNYYDKKEEFQIAFNGLYLRQALESAPGDKVELLLSAELKPGLLRVLDNSTYLHVLMPMQIV
jgi:DNA polymerase III sliding clamp (beta) subunit (PCNA family)